jgi:hypothetical protein
LDRVLCERQLPLEHLGCVAMQPRLMPERVIPDLVACTYDLGEKWVILLESGVAANDEPGDHQVALTESCDDPRNNDVEEGRQ